MDSIQKHGYSLIVIQEILLALKYYTQVVDAIPNLNMNNLDILKSLYKESKNDKVKNNVQSILIQCSKILEYEDYLNKIGASYILTGT